MPTYLYNCPKCGEFEWNQSILDKPLTSCPQVDSTSQIDGQRCGSKVTKLIAPLAGFKMPIETTSPAYQEWFHSESVQNKLRSGEYEIAPKSHNINQY